MLSINTLHIMHVEMTTYVMTGLAEETNRGWRDGG